MKHESEFNSVFKREFEDLGSLAEEIDKTPLPLELVSVIDIELEFEWIEFAFRNVLLEESEGICTKG